MLSNLEDFKPTQKSTWVLDTHVLSLSPSLPLSSLPPPSWFACYSWCTSIGDNKFSRSEYFACLIALCTYYIQNSSATCVTTSILTFKQPVLRAETSFKYQTMGSGMLKHISEFSGRLGQTTKPRSVNVWLWLTWWRCWSSLRREMMY